MSDLVLDEAEFQPDYEETGLEPEPEASLPGVNNPERVVVVPLPWIAWRPPGPAAS
jgi:hypothetical protein